MAAFAASTGYVRAVTREKEYSEGLAEEALRTTRMRTIREAEAKLAACIASAPLEIDCDAVDEAIVEGEQVELATVMLDGARVVAEEAREAQRLHGEREEARRRRREEARRLLIGLQSPDPLNVDTEALGAVIQEAADAGVASVECELAALKRLQAVDVQARDPASSLPDPGTRTRHAHAHTLGTLTGIPACAGPPPSPITRTRPRPSAPVCVQAVRAMAEQALRDASEPKVMEEGGVESANLRIDKGRLDSALQVDPAHRISPTGSRPPDPAHRIPPTGSRPPDLAHRIPPTFN